MDTSSRKTADSPDLFAIGTIALAAVLALALSWMLPWWRMEARAPQYGKQTLVVEVSPVFVRGDVREIDTLGHYVGIRPLGDLAHFERALAPFGLAAASAGLLLAPFLRGRRKRFLAVAPAIALPVAFLIDLRIWMGVTVNERDPKAALARSVPDVDPKIAGAYDVGQFKVDAILQGGFFVSALAGLLGIGLVFVRPAPVPRRRTIVRAAAGTPLLLFALPADAARLEVGPGEKVGAAIARAADGDVIVVRGTHVERVVVDRRVSLVGVGGVLDGAGEGTVLVIKAAGAAVSDLAIRASGDNYRTEDAAVRIEAADVRLSRLEIDDTLFGVFVVKGDGCVIEESTIVGKDLPHVRRGDGIRLWYSSGCVIRDNRVRRSRDVVIWYSSGTVVEDNVVTESRYGLHYMYSDRNEFRRNLFDRNQVGAAIMNSRGIVLEDNSFSASNGPAAHGILLKDADDVAIERNRISGNATGLFFDNAPQSAGGWVRVRANLIEGNDAGVVVQPASRAIEFAGNVFRANAVQVRIAGTGSAAGNLWEGNWWSDATVYDRDRDGRSEIPYRPESRYEDLSDRHPNLAFFAGSPAAGAIDDASRLFPLFQPRVKLEDPRPLAAAPRTGWERSGSEGSAELGAAAGGLLGIAAALARVAMKGLA